MMRRILVSIAVLAVPLSLIAGPAVQAASAQGVSTAVVTPASGPAGSTVTGSGSNWTAGDHIQAYWSDTNGTLGGEVVVAPDGTFTDPGLKIPTGVASGSHQILFSDIEGRYFEVANFDVTGTSPPPTCPANPAVAFSPSSGPLSTTFTITGSGWAPGGKVTATIPYGSPGVFTGYQAPTANDNGSFSYKMTVGTGSGGPTPPGAYVFTYVESYGGCSLSFRETFTVTSSGQQSLQLNVPFATEIGSVPGYPRSGKLNCGPASVTMAIQYYGGSTTVANSAVAIHGSNNGKNGVTDFKPGDTTGNNTVAWLAKFGLTEKNITTLSEIRTELAAGHPVIILVNNYAYRYDTPPPYSSNDGGWFTYAHIVVVTGINSANVIINDPLRSSSNYAIPLATFENAASTAQPTPGVPTGSSWYAASILRG